MKKYIVLTLSILIACAILLTGCGSSSQKFYKYNMEKYVTIPSYEMEIDSSSDDFKNYYQETLYSYLSYREDSAVVINGDIVNIDFVGYVDDTAFEGGTGSDYNLKIGSKTFIDDFEEQLIGAKPGDKKDVNVTFPENYGSSELNGKDATFKVTVNYITRIAELNDENAQKAGFNSAVELADLADKNAISSCAWDAILENINVEKYPNKEMKIQLKETLDAYNVALAEQNFKLEDYAKQNNMSVSEFEKYVKENEVSNMVTTHLIYYGVLDKANYKLTTEDIDKAREYIKAQSEKNNFDFSAYSDMYIESYAAYTAASNILYENAKVK